MLTLKRLKSLKPGEWFWVEYQKPCGIDHFYVEVGYGRYLYDCAGCDLDYATYGTVWKAYRNRESVLNPVSKIRDESRLEGISMALGVIGKLIFNTEEDIALCVQAGLEDGAWHWRGVKKHYQKVYDAVANLQKTEQAKLSKKEG